MRFYQFKQSFITGIIYKLILSILVIIICFPPVNLTFTTGIDPPLSWAFNYLFKNGLTIGQNIIFPHGPLSFFMYPLQENFIIALIATILLQFGIICNLFSLTASYDKKNWLVPILLSIILLKVLNFRLLILTNISLFYLLHYLDNKAFYKYAGLLLTAFAFYVKVHVAVIAVTITASFLIIELFRHRKLLLFAGDTAVQFLLILILWFLMFGSFRSFFPYLYGMLNLAADNSAAVSLYPENNWICLIIFLLTLILVPFLQRTRMALYFGLLFILSFFAAWKYGMAREDIYHARSLFLYAFMLMALFVLFCKEYLPVNMIIICIGLSAFYLNLRNLPTYHPIEIEFLGINNFYDFVTGYSFIKKRADETIAKNLAAKKLPQSILEEIGERKVDVYPFDYSVIPANSLNWQPRPVLQSYVSYTSWLDRQNTKHFNSDAAPEFIIWDLNTITKDLNGGTAESIDNRYLLNDEPGTLLQIIINYESLYKNESFLILKRRDKPLNCDIRIAGNVTCQWDTWIDLPEGNGDIIRAGTTIRNNIFGKILSFFYKNEESWIYYKTVKGEVFKYKIVPENAKDGLWINPFIFKPESQFFYPEVKSIMLKNSNRKVMSDNIRINWEIIDFKNEKDSMIHSFFQKTAGIKQRELLNITNEFEKKNDYWSSTDSNNYITNCYQGSTSCFVPSKSFSPVFTLNLDTISPDPLYIQAGCWITGSESDIICVISAECKNKILVYDAVDLNEQIIDETSWNHVYNYLYWDQTIDSEETILKVYIWNNGDNHIYIDDFNVNLIAEKPDIY
ncbi:MAG: hypothetical protein AMS27_17690 [Bacteroides sp. SM23_62_1]|nr:MAG: hypothetical protein AMS27_17690 [Bacteroides sp. SM23_62_1]